MSQVWLKRLLPVAIIIVAVLIAQAMIALQTAPAKKPNVQPSPNVEVSTIKNGPLTLSVRSQGTVGARRTIEWASEVAGRVIWVSPSFVEGAHIEAGTLLMKLDPTDYQVALAEAEASVADANLSLTEERNEFRRGTTYRSNNKQSATASLRQPKLALVEARYKAAEEKLKQAKADLAATEIRAPFDAVVDNKQVDLGQYVSSNAVLFTLYSTNTAEVRLPVTAAEIYFIEAIPAEGGELPKVELSANFGMTRQQWQGRLVRIERRVDANTRTFFVVADVDQPYNAEQYPIPLSVGLFVDAVIDGITIESGVRIPRSALHGDNFVYVVDNSTLVSRQVTVARRERDAIVISDGLKDGDQVVMTKLDLMVEGMQITVVPEQQLSVGSPAPEA
ncbi:efflux RND transporter periplasmic adaptor subunit [Oceanicoccus sagamiensis]|uniref:Uncharacterized protein n=1 Tax=Oceanicoccus sagamiensis TaxID=716816 RepID=A0A1X9NJ60_9GAMM|nr:efflux RND transporter periplasmic adaptor subunit [Oceanicoccus sagamiensis]ARN74927.1 hypothetical protein BST96_12870 [Oceanicoccus sagamiensis]